MQCFTYFYVFLKSIQEFLSPLLNASNRQQLSGKELTHQGDVALRCLHAFNTHFDSLQYKVLASSIRTILDCVECCQIAKPAVKDPLTVPKLLVHLASKCIKQVRMSLTFPFAGLPFISNSNFLRSLCMEQVNNRFIVMLS